MALTETIYQATEGKLDLLQFPNAKQAAMSGWNTQLTQHVSPAFADSSVDETPNLDIIWYLRKRLNLPIGKNDCIPGGADGDLPDTLIFAFPNSATNIPNSLISGELALRNWFPDGQMLVSRPAPKTACRLSVAMKGGHNAEKHNHNDVGTYVVTLDDVGPQPTRLSFRFQEPVQSASIKVLVEVESNGGK